MAEIIDHAEALLLAQMKQNESNLARCYLEYADEIERLRALLQSIILKENYSTPQAEAILRARAETSDSATPKGDAE